MCRGRPSTEVILIAVIISIFLLTFQDSAGTAKLSEAFRLWFEKIEIHSDYHSFQSNAHIFVYFVLGVVLSLFGSEAGWKWWIVLLVGIGFGLLDEGIKIFLLTRDRSGEGLDQNYCSISITHGNSENKRKRGQMNGRRNNATEYGLGY